MGAILNGLSLSQLRPYGSEFLIFSDYARPALRLSALMEIPVLHICTTRSASAKDRPINPSNARLARARFDHVRPTDANEVVVWRVIVQFHEPVADSLAAGVAGVDRTKYASAEGVARGAYVLADADNGKPDVLLLATGSEVALPRRTQTTQADGAFTRAL